jgi:hypothetical protein
MENLFRFLDEKQIKYTIEKTDPDDSIMVLQHKDLL